MVCFFVYSPLFLNFRVNHVLGIFKNLQPASVPPPCPYVPRGTRYRPGRSAVDGGLAIDGLAQFQATDDRAGAQIKMFVDERGDFFIRNLGSAKGFHNIVMDSWLRFAVPLHSASSDLLSCLCLRATSTFISWGFSQPSW
jgi:hypothetical protein